MADHVPRSFNADGSPKHRPDGSAAHADPITNGVAPSRPRTGRGASDAAAGIRAEGFKAGDKPISPDTPQRAVGPVGDTPVRTPPPEGKSKLRSRGVEAHARTGAAANTALYDDSLTRFSDSTSVVVAALAITVALLGMLTFTSFGGGFWPIVLGVATALAAGLVFVVFLLDRINGLLALVMIVGLMVLGGLGMWLTSDGQITRPGPARTPSNDALESGDNLRLDPVGRPIREEN
jgi:hypothetical protein